MGKKETEDIAKKKETKSNQKEIKRTENKEKNVKKETKSKTVKETKNKKSIFSKITGYFKGVKKEISRIRWTKGKELLKYSIATVSFIIVLGIFFYIIDMLVALLRSNL